MRDPASGRIAFLLAAVFFLAPPAPRAEDPSRVAVREHVLPNGLRILVVERPATFTVACHLVVQVGSADELPGTTGITNLLQRLLLNGTQHIGTRAYDKEQPLLERLDFLHEQLAQVQSANGATLGATSILAARLEKQIQSVQDQYRGLVVPDEVRSTYLRHGARDLGQTTFRDYTQFTCSLPADRFELWALVDSQRLIEPVLRDFHPERERADEERRLSVEIDPDGRLDALVWGTAFKSHPYRWPVLGLPEDLPRIRRQDVKSHLLTYFRPDRMTAVIVGNVAADRVIALMEKYFGRLPAATGGARPPAAEPTQSHLRRRVVSGPGAPRLRMGWPMPAADDPDLPAVEVLAEILGGGRVHRLGQALLAERLCSAVRVEAARTRDSGLFTIAAMPIAPVTAVQAERAISAELRRLREEPPDEAEVATAVRSLEQELARQTETNHGLAGLFAHHSGIGSWKTARELAAGWRRVRPEHVRAAARRLFEPTRTSVVVLERDAELER